MASASNLSTLSKICFAPPPLELSASPAKPVLVAEARILESGTAALSSSPPGLRERRLSAGNSSSRLRVHSLSMSISPPPVIDVSFDRIRSSFHAVFNRLEIAMSFPLTEFQVDELERIGVGVNDPYYFWRKGKLIAVIKPLNPDDNLLSAWKKNIENHLVNPFFSDAELEQVLENHILGNLESSFCDSIPFDSLPFNEHIAYILGASLNVPPCTLIRHKEYGICSMHEYITNEGVLGSCVKSIDNIFEIAEIDLQSVQNIIMLDLLLVNVDRTSGNILVQRDGEKKVLVPIDHGYILPKILTFLANKSCLVERYGYFGSDQELTQASINWMKNLEWGKINSLLDSAPHVDELTKKTISLTSTLLRIIGELAEKTQLKLSRLDELFRDFEIKVKEKSGSSFLSSAMSRDLLACVDSLMEKESKTLDELCKQLLIPMILKSDFDGH